ncbi:MAG: hypothetical protein V4556_08555 [Bacteroidota bacterium]
MKHFFFLIICSFILLKTSAINAPGYIVTLNNDTVYTQIKLTEGNFFMKWYDMKKKVLIIDSTGTVKEFKPTDIKAFGYIYKSDSVVHVAKPIKNGKIYFLYPVVVGEKASLYQYSKTVPQGLDHYTDREFYTFEKNDGTHIFMDSFDPLDSFSQKLSAFYNGNIEIKNLIASSFKARRKIQNDIKAIVEAMNKL